MDREKAIKGFECCMTDMNRSDSMPCKSCPYGTLPKKENCQKRMFADVLALLKEQEAVKPKIDAFGLPYCSKCKTLVYNTWEFCPHCGQELKWDD